MQGVRAEPDITELIDYEEFCGVPGHDHEEGSAGAAGISPPPSWPSA
jgi:hypothetical protein